MAESNAKRIQDALRIDNRLAFLEGAADGTRDRLKTMDDRLRRMERLLAAMLIDPDAAYHPEPPDLPPSDGDAGGQYGDPR